MNYYIQGDPARAEEIKAAFEKKGIDVLDFGFADKTLVYCSIGHGCVQCLPYSINLMQILCTHPDYKELELPVEPKFNLGDWVVATGKCVYLITKIDEFTVILVDVMGDKYEFGADLLNDATLWTVNDAKDGDVLFSLDSKQPFIYKERPQFSQAIGYCCINKFGEFGVWNTSKCVICTDKYVPATKEQCDLLFKKMQEAGYKWNADKKELRKIQPHYNIKNFHVGMPVLVRTDNSCRWDYSVFSRITGNECWHFAVCNGVSFTQCIPFNDDTKHLLGTTDMCDEQYINW